MAKHGWDYDYDFGLICQNCGEKFGGHAGYACNVADAGLVGGPKGFWPASGPLTPVKYQNPPKKDGPGYIPVAPATSAPCGFTKNDWLCTRESKHTGIHVAHGEGVMLYHWGDAPKPKSKPAVVKNNQDKDIKYICHLPNIKLGQVGYIPRANDGNYCQDHSPVDSFVCTLDEGHLSGLHVAHAEYGNMVATWGPPNLFPKPIEPINGKIKRPRKETDKYGNYSILLHEPQLMPGDAGFIKQAGKKKKLCRSKLEHGALYCTRHPNHSGPHVGHGICGNMIASWYSEVEQICLDLF